MNVKLINSKLDFLEDLIVEMNPENLEQLKTICFVKLSEINSIVNHRETSPMITLSGKLNPQSFSQLKEVVVDYFEFEVVKEDNIEFVFMYNGKRITYYKKRNWFSGKGVTDGRGAENLIKQLKR